MEEMLRKMTGAKTVITETLLLRGTAKSGQEPPSANNSPERNSETNEAQSDMHDTTKSGQYAVSSDHDQSISINDAQSEDTKEAQVPTPPQYQTFPSLSLSASLSQLATYLRLPRITHRLLLGPTFGSSTPQLPPLSPPVIAAEDRLLAANVPLHTHYSNCPLSPRWGRSTPYDVP